MLPNQPLVCPVRAHLFDLWMAASKQYAETVSVLGRNLGTVSLNEYNRLVAATEECRLRAEGAKADLKTHRDEHGC